MLVGQLLVSTVFSFIGMLAVPRPGHPAGMA